MSPSSSDTITGACFCGKITYKVVDLTSDKVEGIICHCQGTIHLTQGTPKVYEDFHADSGKRIVRQFCGACGSALYSYPDSMPDKVFVKAGSLDDIDRVVPKVEIFVERVIHGTTREASDRKTTLFEGMMAKQLN